VYYDSNDDFFVWGLIDQTVHFSTMLVRESESGYAPPGVFQVVATGTADLTVYRGYGFLGRLAQDSLLKRQNDVFWSGPIRDRLGDGIQRYLQAVQQRLEPKGSLDLPQWQASLAETWTSTLCRLLISIQRYRHGGALLIARSDTDLDIKYKMNYARLPRALVNLAVEEIKVAETQDIIGTEYLDEDEDTLPIDLYLEAAVAQHTLHDYERQITGCVRFISSLSCVDGLVLATPDLGVRGFGVEILTKKEVRSVYLSPGPNPRDQSLRVVDPSHYGMRHRSMMRYCFAHPKALGFVISQDGEIRAMTRVKNRLIMWENLKVLLLWEQDFKKAIPSRRAKHKRN